MTFEALADHCRVQKTYLSKVLNKDGNLSPDQLFLAAEYLKLTAVETQFLESLYILNTSLVAHRKKRAEAFVEKTRKENLRSESAIKTESQNPALSLMTEKYYLNPNYQLIHMFLTIDRFAKSPHEIAKALTLEPEKLDQLINDLMEWKLIEFSQGRYVVLKNNLHLGKDSHLNIAFRNFSRLSAQSKMNSLNDEDFYAFSAVISCDGKSKDRIQKKFLEFLQYCQTEVTKATSEDVYQINFDLLKWS